MNFIFDDLLSRQLIQQTTNYDKIRNLLNEDKVTFYVGFDATADSLHIGHLIQLITIKRLQNAGHNAIILIGGATTLIGDPTGKNQLRKMLSYDEINNNIKQISKQINNFINLENSKNIILNNMSWFNQYKYIEFIREFGCLFSVNRMIKSECFKSRLEKGLTFLEFNYTLLQSYDFLYLFQKNNCILQIGGNDQWANIIHGVDLIRRIENKESFGLTISLLIKSDGQKMGKTEFGAIWLDPLKTSPYDFFQYWRNINDHDVIKCMKYLTFISTKEIQKYENDLNININSLKQILAFEITKIVHGKIVAQEILNKVKSIFIYKNFDQINKYKLTNNDFNNENNIDIIKLLKLIKFSSSNTESRKLILQSGIQVNNKKVSNINLILNKSLFINGLIIQKGKKQIIKVVI